MVPDPEPTRPLPLPTLVGAAVAIAGAFGPWRFVHLGAQTSPGIAGTSFDGLVVIVLAVVAALAAVLAGRGAPWRDVPALLGGVIVLLALNAVLRALVDDYGPTADATTGWGVWVTLAGGAVVAVDGVLRR